MLRTYDELREHILPLGAMICKILIEADFQAYKHEVPVSRKQKINGRTKSMSDTDVWGWIQEEQAQYQDDDIDEDSIENQLLAVEHAVYD